MSDELKIGHSQIPIEVSGEKVLNSNSDSITFFYWDGFYSIGLTASLFTHKGTMSALKMAAKATCDFAVST